MLAVVGFDVPHGNGSEAVVRHVLGKTDTLKGTGAGCTETSPRFINVAFRLGADSPDVRHGMRTRILSDLLAFGPDISLRRLDLTGTRAILPVIANPWKMTSCGPQRHCLLSLSPWMKCILLFKCVDEQRVARLKSTHAAAGSVNSDRFWRHPVLKRTLNMARMFPWRDVNGRGRAAPDGIRQ